jgi:hypothetical protein
MNSACGREWTRQFICETFPANFVNGPLKKHREDVILDRERALLPATQPYAEAIFRKNAIMVELNEINSQIRDLKRKKGLLLTRLYRVEQPEGAAYEGAADDGERTRKQFVKPCPVDDCRGFLSSQYKCGMCETWCCPDCHAIIGKSKTDAHTCDPNDVESVKALKSDTKPCPKCAVPIFKIDGCDQIWCTQCHIAFSFRTGAIESNIHNPHYYEWLRKTRGEVPRNPLDIRDGVQCNGEFRPGPIIREFARILEAQTARPENEHQIPAIIGVSEKVTHVTRNINHIQLVEIRPQDYEEKNRDLRIRYLTKEIDEEKFKVLLQQAEKKHNKHTEIQNIYQLVITAAKDIIMRYLRFLQMNPYSRDISILDEIIGLVGYANECIFTIQHTYKCTVNIFNESLRLVKV